MPLEAQARLMRVLQEKTSAARVLAGSSRDLERAVGKGEFRRDLYFSLNVVKIKVPELRARKEDIPLLVAHFVEAESAGKERRPELSADFLQWVMEYDWPGNVRELETCVRRACGEAEGEVIGARAMPTQLRNAREAALAVQVRQSSDGNSYGVVPLANVERDTILSALERVAGTSYLRRSCWGSARRRCTGNCGNMRRRVGGRRQGREEGDSTEEAVWRGRGVIRATTERAFRTRDPWRRRIGVIRPNQPASIDQYRKFAFEIHRAWA